MFLGSLTAAAAGFGLFIGGAAVPALLGFFLTGLGVANLYPLALSSALAAAGEAADQGSARATLASGTAILGLPLLLGALADALDLRTAFWLVPLLLCAALGLFTFIQRQNHPRPSLEGVKLGAGSSK
jgi:fucose permease